MNKLDKRSIRNLKDLDVAVISATMIASKKTVYKSDLTKSGTVDAPNTWLTRQQSLNFIDRGKNRKMSGRIIRKVYKKYHITTKYDFIQKLKKIIKKHPVAQAPLMDFANSLKSDVFVAKITKVPGRILPVIAAKDDVPKNTFSKVINDFLKILHRLLPNKGY